MLCTSNEIILQKEMSAFSDRKVVKGPPKLNKNNKTKNKRILPGPV